jgi:hypothetical protein
MQGPLMLKTPSPDSDGLPFHPKYLDKPGYEVMSHEEFRAWLHNNPCAPPMYRSQPVSTGSTRPVSLSSSDSAPLHRRLLAKGQYQEVTQEGTPKVTQQGTPEVVPMIGSPPVSRGHSPCSPLGGLLPLTPLFTQALITGQEPSGGTLEHMHSRQSSGSHTYCTSPVVEVSDIPEGLLLISDS